MRRTRTALRSTCSPRPRRLATTPAGWPSTTPERRRDCRRPRDLPAAAAERTRRIQLGTAIVILPLEDPVRVAEDAAVVDTISGGRLQLGLGTGGDPLTFAAFGRDLDSRRDRFSASVRIIKDVPSAMADHLRRARLYPPAADARTHLGVNPEYWRR